MSPTRDRLAPFAAWLGALVVLGVVGCASTSSIPAGPPMPAPKLAVGDHWQYKIVDNLRRGAVTMLDAEVVSITGGTATLRLVYNDQSGRSEATEEIDAGGGLVFGTMSEQRPRRFPTPIEMYQFPLQQGETWRQTVNTVSPETGLAAQILVCGTVRGGATVTVPAGTFDAVSVYRILQLDDEQFWRTRTERQDSVWFVPQVKGAARELRQAQYTSLSGGTQAVMRTEDTTRDLLSFRPGA